MFEHFLKCLTLDSMSRSRYIFVSSLQICTLQLWRLALILRGCFGNLVHNCKNKEIPIQKKIRKKEETGKKPPAWVRQVLMNTKNSKKEVIRPHLFLPKNQKYHWFHLQRVIKKYLCDPKLSAVTNVKCAATYTTLYNLLQVPVSSYIRKKMTAHLQNQSLQVWFVLLCTAHQWYF